MWLKKIFTKEELSNPQQILAKVAKNLPVSTFVGFLFYHASMVWGTRKAIQVTDVEMLDFMWRFSLRVYGPTRKVHYKKGCVQQDKVRCVPNIGASTMLLHKMTR